MPRKKSDATKILVARTSGEVFIDGKRYFVRRGKTTAHAGHEIVKGNEQMFRPFTVDYAVEEEPEQEEPEAPKRSIRKRAAKKVEPDVGSTGESTGPHLQVKFEDSDADQVEDDKNDEESSGDADADSGDNS